MGNIRKQGLYSSGVIVLGFLVGAFNIWLFGYRDYFSTAEFGLTRIFLDLAQTFMAFASLGMAPILYKFYPYYKDNLEDKKNDLLTICLTGGLIGFVLLCIGGYFAQPLILRKFQNAPLLIEYYFWVFPFTFFFLFFSILENYSWQLRKTIFPNFLKETAIRIVTTVIILLRIFDLISFDVFIKLFAVSYGTIFFLLLFYLIRSQQFSLTFTISRVTKKFYKKIITLFSLTYTSQIVGTLALTLDSMLLASFNGLATTGIYNFATYTMNLAMIPQRGLGPITISHLSKAWKDKNLPEIKRIYQRSSINLLAGGLFIVANIWLGLQDAIVWLDLKKDFNGALAVMVILGISKLVELGTGVNNYVIGTSSFWRFEFNSGMLLLIITLPANYFLVRAYGMPGAALSELIRVFVYNVVRMFFLWRKFNMLPFSVNTIKLLCIATVSYAVAHFLFLSQEGFMAVFTRCGSFTLLFCAGVYVGKVSPDVQQLAEIVRKKLGLR